jgi:polysaccharide biosynthesis protein PslH
MNILFLSAMNPYPLTSGGQRVAYRLLQLFAGKGRVHLVYFYERTNPELPVLLERELADLCVSIDAVPLPMYHGLHSLQQTFKAIRGVFSSTPFRLQKFSSDSMHDCLRSIAESKKFDLIVCDLLHVTQYLDHFPSIPVILHNQNVEWEIFERHSKYNSNFAIRVFSWWEAKRLKRYEINTANQCSHVLLVSERDQTTMIANGLVAQSSVLPYSVSPQRVSWFDTNSALIVSLGNLGAPGRQQGTVWFHDEVWPLVRKRIPNVKWHIIGTIPSQQIINFHNGKNIFVDGLLNENDLHDILQQTQACIVPLFIGGGIRIKILDMFGWGIPCVTTSIAAKGIDADCIMTGDTPVQFADCVIRILTEESLWNKLSLQGLSYISDYHSQQALEGQFNNMITQVIDIHKATMV